MKVGIITFYNGNINYGGMLQAYALQHAIEMMGHEARQVRLDNSIVQGLTIAEKVRLLLKLNVKAWDIWKRKKAEKDKETAIADVREKQRKGFRSFEEYIPHTEKIYTINDLQVLDSEFDVFICGSDQVWTPFSGGFRPVPHRWTYFLDFTDKRKISYAASFGADRIPDDFSKEAMKRINELDAVSVREDNAKKIIQKYLKKNVDVVVDPVFLLSKSEWEKIIIEPKEHDYVLAYVLGNKNNTRNIAKAVAKEKGLELLTVPFIGDYLETDRKFGDKQLIGIDPREFIGYVKNAEIIVTDSFHCAAFAIMFNKKIYLSKRTVDTKKESMNSRIEQLLFTFKERLTCKSYEADTVFIVPKDSESIRKRLALDSINWIKNNI